VIRNKVFAVGGWRRLQNVLYGCRVDDGTDGTQHHFIEDRASADVRSVIAGRRFVVWARMRSPDNCLEATGFWYMEFRAAGVPCVPLGRGSLSDAGGYLRSDDGGVDVHHFLAVGPERALFDPTASQFHDDGPITLDRYLVYDGTPFPRWREEEERNGPLRFVPPAPATRRPWERL